MTPSPSYGKDYVPTIFKTSMSYLLHKVWKPNMTLTFDLLSIEVSYLSRTMYMPSLKLVGQRILEISYLLHKVWENNITFNLDLLTWI